MLHRGLDIGLISLVLEAQNLALPDRPFFHDRSDTGTWEYRLMIALPIPMTLVFIPSSDSILTSAEKDKNS